MNFTTKRIEIRPFTTADLYDVNEYCSVRELAELAGWAPHASIAETQNILAEWIKNGYHNAIVWRETNKVIGHIAIYPDSEEKRDDTKEIGYAVSPAYQGLGIMTEVLTKTVEEVFKQNTAAHLWACCFEENAASKRVIEKSGFQFQQMGSLYSNSLHKRFISYEYRIDKKSS